MKIGCLKFSSPQATDVALSKHCYLEDISWNVYSVETWTSWKRTFAKYTQAQHFLHQKEGNFHQLNLQLEQNRKPCLIVDTRLNIHNVKYASTAALKSITTTKWTKKQTNSWANNQFPHVQHENDMSYEPSEFCSLFTHRLPNFPSLEFYLVRPQIWLYEPTE